MHLRRVLLLSASNIINKASVTVARRALWTAEHPEDGARAKYAENPSGRDGITAHLHRNGRLHRYRAIPLHLHLNSAKAHPTAGKINR